MNNAPIYIFGHKHPDTDTICAAIAYAHLKNQSAPNHIPARLGEMNRETRFVLDHFGIPEPVYLPHVYVRALDVMVHALITAPIEATIYEVGERMTQHNIQNVPVVDSDGRALGIISERSLARGYLRELNVQSLTDTPTTLSKIAETLNGQLIVGDPDTLISGNVVIGAMNIHTVAEHVAPGDLVIVGDRENAQETVVQARGSCLVVTGGAFPTEAVVTLAKDLGTAIIVTPNDTYATARLINLSLPAETLLERDVMAVTPESLINEITGDLLRSPHGVALVNDSEGRLVGLLTKGDVAARRRHRVILVDHSERSQSADGIDRADILEIIDHHRLGGLETSGPILAMIAPVGCTSTLILRRYREMGVLPPREIAGIMVAAILSDTMLLKSPTTTSEDVAAVRQLGHILGQDPLAFGREMYNAKFDIARLSPADIANNDLKLFELGDQTVAIAQVEVGDRTPLLERRAEVLAAMEKLQAERGYDAHLLMVTDIISEGTELLAVGKTRPVERAFDVTLTDGSVWLPGVLSRKKQVVPPLSGITGT